MTISIVQTDKPETISESLSLSLNAWCWFVEHSKHWWWIVLEGKTWLAYGGLAVFDRETLYLGPDHVLREYRGRGLQRLLINKREEWGKQEGYNRMICVVAHDNIYSANNFIKCNWLLRKPWPGTDPKNHYLYFEKDLTK
jgi:GNAT superfamily N-acetyltransferase